MVPELSNIRSVCCLQPYSYTRALGWWFLLLQFMQQREKPGICIVSIIDAVYTILLTLLNRVENPLNRRRSTILARLNISAVESKFFLHPFTCLAKNTEGISTAYIQLIHPGKQESFIWNAVLFSRGEISWPSGLQCYFLCPQCS